MFGLNVSEKKIFARNFISEVSCKLSFAENKKCSSERQCFIDSLKDDYPKCSDGITQEIQLRQMNGRGTSLSVNSKDDEHQIVLVNDEVNRKIILNNVSLVVSDVAGAYQSSEKYDEGIGKIIDAASPFNINRFNSVELRKLNLIGFSAKSKNGDKIIVSQALEQVVSRNLIVAYGSFGDVGTYMRRHIYDMKLVDGDYELNIKYGLILDDVNADVTEVKGKLVVDLSIKKNSATEIAESQNVLRVCHKELYNAFCWCTSDEFKNVLNNAYGER